MIREKKNKKTEKKENGKHENNRKKTKKHEGPRRLLSALHFPVCSFRNLSCLFRRKWLSSPPPPRVSQGQKCVYCASLILTQGFPMAAWTTLCKRILSFMAGVCKGRGYSLCICCLFVYVFIFLAFFFFIFFFFCMGLYF